MICSFLRASHSSPRILQRVIHMLFLLSPTFFFFQKDCGSLSFNYGVLKDSSAAFMLANFILPLIAPYSPDFLIPQNLLSGNLIPLYSCIVRTHILLFSKWVVCGHGPFACLLAIFKCDFFFISPSTLLQKKKKYIIISFLKFQILQVIKILPPSPVRRTRPELLSTVPIFVYSHQWFLSWWHEFSLERRKYCLWSQYLNPIEKN